MIKDILTTLPTSDARPFALDYSVSVARTFEAHLVGVAFVQDLAISGSVFDGATAVVLDNYHREVEAAARVAEVRFDETRRREGLSAESIVFDAGPIGVTDLLGRAARRFDLTILPQASPEGNGLEEAMIEAALFGSGRPVLVVPYFQESGLKLDRILVCWDGSHNATRAIADAMPFLKRAKDVEVVTVTADGKDDDDIPGMGIAHHLSRHGVNVEVRNIVAHDQDVATRIRSHAAQQSADLIVMGGYGHSRLREFFLGGATREILQSTIVPTLMSH